MVDWIVATEKKNDKKEKLTILDIGTGTGCIPISLKKNIPQAEVSAIDVSEEALKVARKNAESNQVEINFILQNILETEEFVDWIVETEKKNNKREKLAILDIGTGTGCIPISLKKNIPQAEISAIDVSEEALKIARKNAESNQVEINFILQNILETEDLKQQFDIIVSNPPYVRNLEKQEIKKNVLEFEPHLALFVEDTDALLFYRKIAQLALKNLTPNGLLFFEINQYLGKETVELLENLGFKNIELKKDIYGNDRMIKCTI